MKQLYRLSHEESLHPSKRILTIKTLSDRNWIFVICAVIRLPLTQTSEIHTEAHTSAEISQVFPLFYSGTKTFHIDFAAAEIHSVQFVTVSKCSCCRTDRVCEPTSDLRAWSFSVFCVDLLVILYVSLLKQVLACCSANVGRRWTHNVKRQSETCPEDFTVTAPETEVGMSLFVCLCNWLAPSS